MKIIFIDMFLMFILGLFVVKDIRQCQKMSPMRRDREYKMSAFYIFLIQCKK